MAKVASSTPKRVPAAKKPAPPAKRDNGTRKGPALAPAAPAEPGLDLLAPVSERLNALDEKLTTGLSALVAEVQALKTPPGAAPSAGDAPADTFLPVVADLIRRSLMEHLTPVTAALKRLEERIGFIGNRLKYPAGGQERQKPWRHDQPRHPRPSPRPHTAPRPGPGQPWTPPSAASVQGHFAPRPLGGGERHPALGEEEE